ncbi:MAG: AAA family ATPase [Nitrosomonadales bacterium]|nr:AAA family ATPase [Nitrosomonadales bacterium]
MYLEHFGLDSPPFKITPVTDFFFSGANRGEILDALIYAITESEGIIKITGEVGSGKTMLCRMLLERLPQQVESVYLANPSLSREEMLYAIADGLGLNLEGQRVNVIMQTLQNLLAQKAAGGKRVVVLVDEAHAMPLDTLEELRLLYNLQIGNHKLLQIVLFGQPELNTKLEQPNMRQLKDRIVHHFTMLPLSKPVIESYLLFRLRTAGYRGPSLFSAAAINLIGKASQGLMRRVNILADKALLAAFVESAYNIEERHVQAAIRDSELAQQQSWSGQKIAAVTGAATLAAALLIGIGWMFGGAGKPAGTEILPGVAAGTAGTTEPKTVVEPAAPAVPADASAVPSAAPATGAVSGVTASAVMAATATTAIFMEPSSAVSAAPASAPAAMASAAAAPPAPPATQPDFSAGHFGASSETKSASHAPRLQQRLAATKEMLANTGKNSTSIQLFYTSNTQPSRVEGFLARADGLGKLAEIYVLPIRINGSPGYRILYGSFPDVESARAGMEQLPPRYRKAFAPALYLLDKTQAAFN